MRNGRETSIRSWLMQEKSTAFEKKNFVPEKSYIFLGFLIGETIIKTCLYAFQTAA